jgi:hypothetical protein
MFATRDLPEPSRRIKMARREMPFMDHRRLTDQPLGTNKLVWGRTSIAMVTWPYFSANPIHPQRNKDLSIAGRTNALTAIIGSRLGEHF